MVCFILKSAWDLLQQEKLKQTHTSSILTSSHAATFWLTELKMCSREPVCSSRRWSCMNWSPTCARVSGSKGAAGRDWLWWYTSLSWNRGRRVSDERDKGGGREGDRQREKEHGMQRMASNQSSFQQAVSQSVSHSVHRGVGPLDWSRRLVSPTHCELFARWRVHNQIVLKKKEREKKTVWGNHTLV